MKSWNLGHVGVDGVGPFQVYSTINWILHCKVDGEDNHLAPLILSTTINWNLMEQSTKKFVVREISECTGC